jgi:hypothetical protein
MRQEGNLQRLPCLTCTHELWMYLTGPPSARSGIRDMSIHQRDPDYQISHRLTLREMFLSSSYICSWALTTFG